MSQKLKSVFVYYFIYKMVKRSFSRQNVFPPYWWTFGIYFPISLHSGWLRFFGNYAFGYKTHPRPLLSAVLFPRDQCRFHTFSWYRHATLSFSSGGQFFLLRMFSIQMGNGFQFQLIVQNQSYCGKMCNSTV